PKAKAALQEIWMAATRGEAERAFDQFLTLYRPKYPDAIRLRGLDTDPFQYGRLKYQPYRALARRIQRKQGGAARLQDPEFTVGKGSLISPLTRVLPGWMLVFDPPTASQDSWLPSQGG
ncbi:MAG: hypothetical protein ACREI9_14585, partial [Nitrospiraceae bacterium]